MRAHHAAAILGIVFAFGCDGEQTIWAVDLRTDLVPVAEFAGVEVRVTPAGAADEPPILQAQRIAVRGDDYVEGQRIVEWRDAPTEQVLLTVDLVDGSGAVVASSTQLLVPPRPGTTLVLVARSCRGVSCPVDQQCRSGRCVPACDGAGCESMCASADECPGGAACAERRCVEGVCLFRDDGSCGAGEYCDPEVGCRDLPGADGGVEGDAGPPLDGGTCESACASPTRCCSGACVDMATDPAHCGACGNECAAGESCCGGVCTDTAADPSSCGGCGDACDPGGACCDSGCVDLDSDPDHCGACGARCGAGDTCCGGTCVHLPTNEANCGTCGEACPTGDTCSGGRCCPAGHAFCDGSCVDIESDSAHCGACDNTCGPLASCVGGVCRAL